MSDDKRQFVLWRLAVRGTTAQRTSFYEHLIALAAADGVEIYDLPEETHPALEGGDDVQEAPEH